MAHLYFSEDVIQLQTSPDYRRLVDNYQKVGGVIDIHVCTEIQKRSKDDYSPAKEYSDYMENSRM